MRSVNRYYSGLPSDHFDGLRFFNPDHPDTDRGLRDLLRWKLKEKAAPWPRTVPVRQTVPDARVAALRVTIVGHASVLIQAGGLTQYAAGNRATIARVVNGKLVSYTVRVADLMKEGDVTANVELAPGDVLTIPQSWF